MKSLKVKNLSADELQKVYNDAYNERRKRETAEAIKQNRKFENKYYRYENTFGTPGETWWLYVHTLKLDKTGGWIKCLKFQEKHGGIFEAEKSTTSIPGERYTPITKKEFDAAWRAFKSKISKLA